VKQRAGKTPFVRCKLGLSTGIVFFLLVGVGGIVSAFGAETWMQQPNATPVILKGSVEPVYSVVSPLGDSTVRMITMAPRLNTLEGKTVCMVWNHAFKSDITLPAIGESLKNRYPGIKIIPYTEIDAAIRAAGRDSSLTEAEILQTVFKEKGCDAVISGNGG
jgi:hypothetical protein